VCPINLKFYVILSDNPRSEKEQYTDDDSSQPRITRVSPHQWRHIKGKPGLIPNAGTLLVSRPSSIGKHHRLAINSKFLLGFLSNLADVPITEGENIWVWPFKYIAVYEGQIRKALEDAQNKCNEIELESVANTLPNTIGAPTTIETLGRKAKMERDHLRCLVEFMDEDLQNIFDVRKRIHNLSLKTIAFDFLWHLFKPGDLVLSQPGRREAAMLQAFVVLHVTGGRTSFDPGNLRGEEKGSRDWDMESESEQHNEALSRSGYQTTTFIIDCAYLDFDGTFIGPKPRRFAIPAYPGEKQILSLDVYPAKFDPDYISIMESLANRGKRFLRISKLEGAHQRYCGTTIREAQGQRQAYSYFEINAEEVSFPACKPLDNVQLTIERLKPR
jgi:hypothetical protein